MGYKILHLLILAFAVVCILAQESDGNEGGDMERKSVLDDAKNLASELACDIDEIVEGTSMSQNEDSEENDHDNEDEDEDEKEIVNGGENEDENEDEEDSE